MACRRDSGKGSREFKEKEEGKEACGRGALGGGGEEYMGWLWKKSLVEGGGCTEGRGS